VNGLNSLHLEMPWTSVDSVTSSFEQLVATKMVQDYADLYSLKSAQLQTLDRMGAKSADKLVLEIGKSRDRGLVRVINALGIRHVGHVLRLYLQSSFLQSMSYARQLSKSLQLFMKSGTLLQKVCMIGLQAITADTLLEDLSRSVLL